MKKELSSVEVKYLADEFQQLIDSKIDKIYQPGKKDVLLSFHVPRIGKKMLRIALPGFTWLTETKPEMPTNIHGFCMVLRKYLSSARLRKIEQINSERILKLEFETKEANYDLIIELFGKGNIILCQNNKIITPLSVQKWKDRTIKKGEIYTPPSKEHNPFTISAVKFKTLIHTSADTISKTLAVQLGIGGTYAAELCLKTDVNKTVKKIDEQEIRKLYKHLTTLLQQKIEPIVVFDENKIIDITPFKLEAYAKNRQERFKTYSQALDSVLSKGARQKKRSKADEKFEKKLEQIEKKIELQQKSMNDQEKKSKENQQKGEKIYEKYQELKTLFAEIRNMRKAMSWKEVKEKLKTVKYIKEINEKTGEIVLKI